MYTRKYSIQLLLLAYFIGLSMAVLQNNFWLILIGPVTHGVFYVLLKAMAQFLISSEKK